MNATKEQALIAKTLDRAASKLGIDFIGGYSALVHKGMTKGDETLFDAIPEALRVTERVMFFRFNWQRQKQELIWMLFVKWGRLLKKQLK